MKYLMLLMFMSGSVNGMVHVPFDPSKDKPQSFEQIRDDLLIQVINGNGFLCNGVILVIEKPNLYVVVCEEVDGGDYIARYTMSKRTGNVILIGRSNE